MMIVQQVFGQFIWNKLIEYKSNHLFTFSITSPPSLERVLLIFWQRSQQDSNNNGHVLESQQPEFSSFSSSCKNAGFVDSIAIRYGESPARQIHGGLRPLLVHARTPPAILPL